MNRRALIAGVGMLAGALLLGLLVSGDDPPAFDAALARGAHDAFGPGVGGALRATSDAIRSPWHWIAGGVFALLTLRLRGRRAALVVALSVVAAVLLTRGLKDVFERPRPAQALVGERAIASKTSYPSGHVSWTAAAFGSLALVLGSRRRRALSGAGFALAVLLVAWVAASRIYLGRHFFTDTVGSALLGFGIVLGLAGVIRLR